MRGRKPKPTVQKKLAGNPGCRRLNPCEAHPRADLPICPEWLDDEAKREWNSIVPDLMRAGLLTAIDKAALAGYCQSFADLKDAVETLRREGNTGKNGQGTVVAHPAVAQKNKAMAMLHKFLVEFGLSPSSRSRVAAVEKPEDDFEEMMRSA